MPRIPLLGGAYKQATLIAGAQRCVNLYPEIEAERAQAPVPVVQYSRPGLTPLGTAPPIGRGRGIYAATNGDLYCVIDQIIYYVNPDFIATQIGTLPTVANTPVSFSDNGAMGGNTIFLVDGSTFGAQINMTTRAATFISDPNFMGSVKTDFLDGFNIFNKPNSVIWYCTQSYSNVFNNLFVGQKTAWPDNIVSFIVNERQVWIFGQYKGEVWANAGLAPFPFALLSGNIVEYGLAGSYALVKQGTAIYWLSQSPEGSRVAMASQGISNQADRISTHAIEDEWLGYPTVSDVICVAYQLRGHSFIEYHFPTADRTWVFDQTTQEWHEKATFDSNGVQHRSIDTFKAFTYGINIAQDWNTGQLYQVDETNFSDNGVAIRYIRGIPHLVNDQTFNPITVWRIMADMECGNGTGVVTTDPWSVGFSTGFGPIVHQGPSVLLRISRDRGFSFKTHSIQTLGLPGGYNTKPTWNRCGLAYDFVPELQWEGPLHTALNGIFAEIEDSPSYE